MSETLTKDEKAKAKRDAEAARRAEIKKVKDEFASREAELPEKLDAEQRKRALSAPAGLRKNAFRVFVETGKTLAEQAEEAKAAREAKGNGRAKRTPKDPEADALARAAAGSAPGLKSRFRPLEGRQMIDRFEVSVSNGVVSIARTDIDASAKISRKHLVAFRDDEDFEEKSAVRASITALGKDTRLWGRKFAAFVLARLASE